MKINICIIALLSCISGASYSGEVSSPTLKETNYESGKIRAHIQYSSDVEIDRLITEEAKKASTPIEFFNIFNGLRSAIYPKSEIRISFTPTEGLKQSSTDKLEPRFITSGYLQYIPFLSANVRMKRNETLTAVPTPDVPAAYGSTAFIAIKSGKASLYQRTGGTGYAYQASAGTGGGATGVSAGYPGYAGAYAQCDSATCVLTMVTYILF